MSATRISFRMSIPPHPDPYSTQAKITMGRDYTVTKIIDPTVKRKKVT